MVTSSPTNDPKGTTKKKPSTPKKGSREDRLAEQLRANLRRRKTASRSNTAPDTHNNKED